MSNDLPNLGDVEPEAPGTTSPSATSTEAEEILGLIDQHYASIVETGSFPWIGASSIGEKCDAFLAMKLRSYPNNPIPPRVQRIFALGNKIEELVVEDVRAALVRSKPGWEFQPIDPDTGKQFSFRAYGGHVRGRSDGLLKTPSGSAIVEIKSMGMKPFTAFKTKGVKSSHPKYYSQAQAMMGMRNIPKTIFVAYCKDNSEYHSEEVAFDVTEYRWLMARVEIVMNNSARKISDDPTSFACRFCSKSEVCQGKIEPTKTCLSCGFAEATKDGKWFCTFHSKEAEKPCDQWVKYMPLPK
jgi:hypothetical protein